MSRSYKKPIIKDKGRRDYNKVFRRKTRQALKKNKEPPKKTREVVNGYDVCDYIIYFDKDDDYEYKERAKRK